MPLLSPRSLSPALGHQLTGGQRSARSQRGFSLIEVLLATLLLGYASTSLESLMMAGRHKAALTEGPVTARLLANEIHLLAKLLPREASGSLAATSPETLLAFDSLDGAVLSPPLLADKSVYDQFSDWTQEVTVMVATLSNPAAAAFAAPMEGLSPLAAEVYQLRVRVLKSGQEVESFSYWLRP
jgi:prepilin-type N-terminal cleavage/methylation domain-containing protein